MSVSDYVALDHDSLMQGVHVVVLGLLTYLVREVRHMQRTRHREDLRGIVEEVLTYATKDVRGILDRETNPRPRTASEGFRREDKEGDDRESSIFKD
jgi:hypothetical protein